MQTSKRAKNIMRRLRTLTLIAALVLVSGVLTTRKVARAAATSYTVMAGYAAEIGVDILAFAPQTIRIHRGDTVTWQFAPIHNVHFATKPVELVIVTDIDGQMLPEINPIIITPSGESGATWKEGFNTSILGEPSGPTTFSVVMDVPPGTYTYLCDLHAGMVGTIVVTEDVTEVPTPEEVTKEAEAQISAVLNAAEVTALKAYDAAAPNALSKDGKIDISAGFTEQTASINRYYPNVAVIKEGETVNWFVPAGLEPHTVTFPMPADGALPPSFAPVVDKKNVPHLVLSETLQPLTKSGSEYSEKVSSGLILPGQNFEIKFPAAGTFYYFCAIHPGQIGTVVVLSNAKK